MHARYTRQVYRGSTRYTVTDPAYLPRRKLRRNPRLAMQQRRQTLSYITGEAMLSELVDYAPKTWAEAISVLNDLRAKLSVLPRPVLDVGGIKWRVGDIILRNGSDLAGCTAVLLITDVYPNYGIQTMGYVVGPRRTEIKTDWRMTAYFIADCMKNEMRDGKTYWAAVRKVAR